jgi:hypothetical protein
MDQVTAIWLRRTSDAKSAGFMNGASSSRLNREALVGREVIPFGNGESIDRTSSV